MVSILDRMAERGGDLTTIGEVDVEIAMEEEEEEVVGIIIAEAVQAIIAEVGRAISQMGISRLC